nr:MAG TPA: hypothetical protein [Caudoviricetes sp.]
MIPVVTMNKNGELGYQVFNDNLAPVEQINRKVLTAFYTIQTKLTNDFAQFGQAQGELKYKDTKMIDDINKAADKLVAEVNTALTAFETAIVVPKTE